MDIAEISQDLGGNQVKDLFIKDGYIFGLVESRIKGIFHHRQWNSDGSYGIERKSDKCLW